MDVWIPIELSKKPAISRAALSRRTLGGSDNGVLLFPIDSTDDPSHAPEDSNRRVLFLKDLSTLSATHCSLGW